MLQVDNFPAGDGAEVTEVYQRCILVSGRCSTSLALEQDEGYIRVETNDDSDKTLFPEQRWPMCRGHFKALVLLSPGINKIIITSGEDAPCRLETPPLHLAILIAKDSPLLIDCPPAKLGSLSSAHSSLDAAISKFRMTAYMWQALTAEDLRAKGLGRRSFRLEEEWTTDTLSQRSLYVPTASTVPKVHLIRTERTVAELRDAQLAQQNPHARQANELHRIFSDALLAHGPPFTTQNRPIVAGLILDSHYDLTGNSSSSSTNSGQSKPYILAHAALGSHNPAGLSLGIFGSHLTYAWPRFLEEVPACLLDATPPDDTVGNDNGECNTMWQACAVGQGAFLHEVRCDAGIAQVIFSPKGGKKEKDNTFSIANPLNALNYSRMDLVKQFGTKRPLALEVTAMNGKQCSIANVWELFRTRTVIRVPGTNIRLMKQSVSSRPDTNRGDEDSWEWGVLLKKRDSKGELVAATKIDIRVGCALDGAEVYYEDGTKIPCGPRGPDGRDPSMGGHQARKLAIPRGVEISKVAVTDGDSIIGFFGTSGRWGMCYEFGIVTAPRNTVLPDSVYDLEKLQNKPEQAGHRNKRPRVSDPESDGDDDTSDDECEKNAVEYCTSEDEDGNYDDSDPELEAVYQGLL
ncbi:putative peptidase family-domain-containing protein [Thermothelomyces heterothallicus CBS 202.75]|uniref:putative peptidase family-domain-containing protein n=1 Tax=Thermothelomyces heterothallicus CBS 202.75 TaxID=1149848 RepID=UPI0037444D56